MSGQHPLSREPFGKRMAIWSHKTKRIMNINELWLIDASLYIEPDSEAFLGLTHGPQTPAMLFCHGSLRSLWIPMHGIIPPEIQIRHGMVSLQKKLTFGYGQTRLAIAQKYQPLNQTPKVVSFAMKSEFLRSLWYPCSSAISYVHVALKSSPLSGVQRPLVSEFFTTGVTSRSKSLVGSRMKG